MRLILLLFVFVNFFSNVNSQSVLPRNLDEAILYFQKKWSKANLDSFKHQEENEAVVQLHFTTGLWIRNNWVRGDRDTMLIKYFGSFGIYNPDDISSIILVSLHRKLNNKNIDFQNQIKLYKKKNNKYLTVKRITWLQTLLSAWLL